ncbi:MAG: FAD-dependent oxidoreductase [bacterium]|nr:FAD-dependent oxidoreductase [bacterium]
MAKSSRVLVIGGVAAGMSAASQVKRRSPGSEVVVFERGEYISYGSCGIPYNLEDPERDIKDLVVVTPEQAREKRNLDIRLRHEVVAIDTRGKSVTVFDLDSEQHHEEPYDALVIASGAQAIQPQIPGIDLSRVMVLRDLEDGAAIKQALSESPSHATIIGAGYIGMEMAHVLRSRGLRVTVLEKAKQILPDWHADTVERVRSVLKANEVEVVTGTTVTAFNSDQAEQLQSVTTEKTTIETGFALVAIGIRPGASLAAEAGLRIGDSGAIWVNQHQQTSDPYIWAAGDCAEAYHRILRKNVWVPLGTTANKQGRTAGANAVGGKTSFKGIVGTAGFLVFDLEVARTGLTLDLAKREGFDPVWATIKQRSRGHSHKGGAAIQVTLIADGPTGLLLGGEITGREGAALRINVLATTLASHMAVYDLQNLDLVYAPPFAPVWDPLLVAANQLAKKIRR